MGKQSRRIIWACFHIPAQSAFRYSTTAEMYKGNTFYLFWLREAAAIWRVGTPCRSWCILNDQVSTRLPASFFVKKKKKNISLVVEFVLNGHMMYNISLSHRGNSICICSDQTLKEDFFPLKGILFFLTLTVQSRYCQYCAMRYSSFVFWTNLCNRLGR